MLGKSGERLLGTLGSEASACALAAQASQGTGRRRRRVVGWKRWTAVNQPPECRWQNHPCCEAPELRLQITQPLVADQLDPGEGGVLRDGETAL